jgi:O-antigen ligase
MVAVRPDVRQRALSTGSSGAAGVRAVIWSQATAILWDHPYGIGLGNYPEVVARYYGANDPLTESPRTYPHSLWLMAWAEAGPLGAAGFGLFWLQLWLVGAQGLVRGASARHKQAGAALLFTVTAMLTVGLTHDVLFHNIVALVFFCALGLATAELHQQAGS